MWCSLMDRDSIQGNGEVRFGAGGINVVGAERRWEGDELCTASVRMGWMRQNVSGGGG